MTKRWGDLPKALEEISRRSSVDFCNALINNPVMDREQMAFILRGLNAKYGGAAKGLTVGVLLAERGAKGFADLERPVMAEAITREHAEAMAKYALRAYGPDQRIERALASLDRSIWNASRETVRLSTEAAGTGYVRVPRIGACPFCLMLASRGAVYKRATVEVTKSGRKYHDHCHCMPREVLPGEDLPLINQALQAKWEGLGSPSLAAWDQVIRWERSAASVDRFVAKARKLNPDAVVAAGVPKKGAYLFSLEKNGQERLLAFHGDGPILVTGLSKHYAFDLKDPGRGVHTQHAVEELKAFAKADVDGLAKKETTYMQGWSDARYRAFFNDDLAAYICAEPDGVEANDWKRRFWKDIPVDGGMIRVVVAVGKTSKAEQELGVFFKTNSIYPDSGAGVMQYHHAKGTWELPLGSGEIKKG